MPMIKRRRRMNKKKRRCLFGAEIKATADLENEDKTVNRVEPSSKKKTKNGRIVADIKVEKESIEKSNLAEESKPKLKSVKESGVKKEIEQPLKESIEDIKNVSKPKSKPPTKTKQRYCKSIFILNVKQIVLFKLK